MKKGLKLIMIGMAGLVISLVIGGCSDRHWCRSHDPEGIMKMIDSEVNDLKLTPDQQEKYEDIRKRLETDVRRHMDTMRQLHAEAEKDLDSPNPDVNALTARLKSRLAEQGNPHEKILDYFLEFYNILDENQKRMVLEHFRSRHGCFGKRF